MNEIHEQIPWLRRGRQRVAVGQVMRKPMTGSELCQAARRLNPRIQLRDIWFLMAQFQEQGLAICLNPRQTTGRLYSLTNYGRLVVQAAFGTPVSLLPAGMNWQKYSWVVRARIRRISLCGLKRLCERTGEPQTAASLRKFLKDQYPLGLNPIIRALKELMAQKLVANVGVTSKRQRKLYRPSQLGLKVCGQLEA